MPLYQLAPASPTDNRHTRGSGGEAESILVIGCPMEPANLAPVRENSMFCYGPLVSELGGPRVHGAPNPVIGGEAGARQVVKYKLHMVTVT